jgi:hypothetical protein
VFNDETVIFGGCCPTQGNEGATYVQHPLLLVGRSGTGKTFLLMHGVSVDCDPIPRQAFLSSHITKRC